ncbi:MAG TPA: gluconate 2-dehydrogenase subunit 3 family protein [Terriglobales bacterium]|nr:gluconate 2-dehydrogenase subunit 3 family protein [Terriglobales bacterium]
MHRRQALRLLASAATLPLLSREAFSMFQAVHEQLPEQAVLKTLNPHQNATVTTISELIIPQTDTPGAKAARVNEFIDLIVTDWYDEEESSTFLSGLADVDSRTRDLFGKDFVDCAEKQQVEVLQALDDEVAAARAELEVRRRRSRPPEKNFFFMIKQLTLVGYYTSQIGFEQELHGEIIPSRHAACVPLEEEAAK